MPLALSPSNQQHTAGDLDISCSQTGLSLSLSFAKNHTVKGVIEQQLKTSTHHQAVQAVPTAAAGASSSVGAGAASDAVGIGSSGGGSGSVMGGAAAAAGVLKPHIIGSLEGSWLGGTITVTCPDMVRMAVDMSSVKQEAR